MAASDLANAAQTLATAILAATSDPADAIRLLLPLTQWIPDPPPGSGPLAQQAQAAQLAIASNLRCSACAALAQAATLYQPTSYQDAQSLRSQVCAALDAEATRAADAGQDATYQGLRELRAGVALDLAVRGANLAWLVEVTTRVPTPALTMSQTLYQDATREPQLVASANPPHPLFMPLSFPALAS